MPILEMGDTIMLRCAGKCGIWPSETKKVPCTTKNKIVIKDLTAVTILIETSFYWLYVGLGRHIHLSNSQAREGGTVQHEQGEFCKLNA